MRQEVREVWELIKDKVDITEEEFLKRVENLRKRLNLTDRALAIIVASKLGVDTSELLHPPLVGRLLSFSSRKVTVDGVPYRLFTLVNNKERYFCVAFGEEKVSMINWENEDKVFRIRRYVETRLGGSKAYRAGERSIVEILPDDYLPPVTELRPAKGTIEKALNSRLYYIVKFMVLEEESVDYLACPICGKGLEAKDSDLICPEHGIIREAVTKTVLRYKVADSTGIYSAVYFGEYPGPMKGKLVTAKGFGKEGDFHITKFYEAEDIEDLDSS